MVAPEVVPFRRLLLPWAASVRRDLPWRRTRDPWAILVSEVMLQQTQVRRVVPKWDAFMARFPTPAACADAPMADIIRAWEGLGYHRRGAALRNAATVIADSYGGVVPSDLGTLIGLPGIGSYTARAVRTFAYEMNDGVVDTNAARVIARAVAGEPCTSGRVQELADALVPPGQGWAWNQGMLDLGAMRCTKRSPRCDDCPVAPVCVWRSEGCTDPDPASGSAGVSGRQSRFEGSDRQGRGRILAAARLGDVEATALRAITGWTDGARIDRGVEGLIHDGLLRRAGDVLRLA